jgi:ribosomal protein S18 acetylase RimI-like enzyme
MEIRQATGSDVSAVKRVAERSWENDYPEFVSRETIDDTVEDWYAEEKLTEVVDADDAEIFVADDDGIVGFAHAVWDQTEGDILRLYVSPESRREGVGTELLGSVRDELFGRGVDRIRAMVLAENELGNAFYEEHGFERSDENETQIGDEKHPENVYTLERVKTGTDQ